jgi:autotransporter-associated beta strand protein
MSGYGENKTIVLAGSSAGTGELAFPIDNVYDRKGKATTAITKTGTGTWTLSGKNTYTGPTIVKQGTLLLPNTHSLGDKTDVAISQGGMLDLSFSGEMRISKLDLDGKPQAPGTYNAENSPKFIKGKGVLKIP